MKLKLFPKFKGDGVILTVIIFLTVISFLAVLSSKPDKVLSHVIYIFISLAIMYGVYCIKNYIVLTKFVRLGVAVAVIMLVLSMFSGDAKSGRELEIFGFRLQVFYPIGFLVIFYISKYLANFISNGQELSTKNVLFLFLVVGGFCAGMAKSNMSTAIILFVTSMVVMFIGDVPVKYLLSLFAVIVVMTGLLFAISPDLGRLGTFGNRLDYYITQDNSNDYGTQMIWAKAAIARSLKPAGPGHGVIKKILPEKETDYVYATICEEFGVVVGLFIIFLYLVLFARSWIVARECQGSFGMLLAMGIGFWITFQALVHIGVNCELLPATGQTLPFISRGGSSMIFSGATLGLLLNISKCNNREKEEKGELKTEN
ncbi:MAG: FtsW/RodA/SpoVE family cell cycle protein [Bacteroidales bacterium]|nr:FtsW/RodA/SpoVE family cell cycle protein [Bacteroidales bacterium]